MSAPRKRLIAVAVIAAAAAAGGAAWLGLWQGGQLTSSEIVLYGNVDIREADLAFNVGGRVESMRVEEGDEVGKGQLLATLEPETYEAEVAAAKARLAAQQATLDRLLAGSRPEEIKESRADVQAIQADLEEARADLKRTERLVRTDTASRQKLDQDRARVNSLTAQLEAAQQRLALAIQGPRSEDIAEARAQLRARQAELALAQTHLRYTKLFAGARGVIKTRVVEQGAVVLPQAPVYTLALTDPVWVRTYVPEKDLGRVRPGMKAEIFTDSAPGRAYGGWVGFISPVAEFTPKTVETPELRTSLVYRVRVYVRNEDDSLRQGMPVTVRLKPGAGDDGARQGGGSAGRGGS